MKRIHNTDSENLDLSFKYKQIVPKLKPVGLWYGIDFSWINWVRSNQPEWEDKHLFGLELEENSLYRIESIKQLNELIKEYGFDDFLHSMDWLRLSENYKGIEIVNYYQLKWGDTFIMQPWFLGWDCNSGCIWDLSAVKSFKKC